MSAEYRQKRRAVGLDGIEPEAARELHAYWRLLVSGETLPRRKALDVTSLRPAMTNLALLEITRMPFRARYRIVGANLIRLLGFDPTNKAIDEVYDAGIVEEVHEAIQRVTLYRKPRYDVKEFRILATSLGYRRLLLPLEKEADGKQYVILCIFPIQSWLQTAADWKKLLTGPKTAISGDFSRWKQWSGEAKRPPPQTKQVLV